MLLVLLLLVSATNASSFAVLLSFTACDKQNLSRPYRIVRNPSGPQLNEVLLPCRLNGFWPRIPRLCKPQNAKKVVKALPM